MQLKKKKSKKDFLSQTGTAKFQKTRSSCEVAHAGGFLFNFIYLFGANRTRCLR